MSSAGSVDVTQRQRLAAPGDGQRQMTQAALRLQPGAAQEQAPLLGFDGPGAYHPYAPQAWSCAAVPVPLGSGAALQRRSCDVLPSVCTAAQKARYACVCPTSHSTACPGTITCFHVRKAFHFLNLQFLCHQNLLDVARELGSQLAGLPVGRTAHPTLGLESAAGQCQGP